jgi:hypothetical protein
MSALAQCDAFGFIYDQAGDPAADILVVLKRVLDASGNPILLSPKTTVTDSAGSFHFTLPELATAFISARASALWNCPDGRAFTVPPGPSGELIPSFALPASTLVEPPLVYVGDVLSIPKASASQDGYLSAADFVAFEAGAGHMGITQIDTGTGLTGGPITDTGTIALATIPGVAGTWSNPTSITINGQGQIIAITATADTTAPVISAISATSITSSGATIIWTTDDFSDSQVEYGPTTSYGTSTTLDATMVTSHSVSISGTTASTLYHYRVKSRNTAGLLTTSGDDTFTTTATVDTTPPVISAVTATSITNTGATITWTTDEASDSQVDYGLTTSYGSTTTLDATMVTSHSVPIAGTAASTLYHYHVKSRNAASLLQTSGDNTFTTAALPVIPNHLLTGLTAMWQLEESGSANRVDSHGTNTLIAYPLTPGSVANGPGVFASTFAAHLTGDGNRLYSGSNSALQTGAIDYTWAYWLKLDAKTESVISISKAGDSGGTGDEFILGYEYGSGAPPGTIDRLRFTVQGGSVYTTVYSTTAGSPVVGTWYLVVLWHQQSDNSIHIRINGGTEDSTTVVPPLVAAADSLNFGAYGFAGAGSLLHGLIDEAAFWHGHIVSSGDVDALWNGGAGLPFSDWTL